MRHERRGAWIWLAVALGLAGCAPAQDGARALATGHGMDPSRAAGHAGNRPHAPDDALLRFMSPANAAPGTVDGSFPVTISRQAAMQAARTGAFTAILPDGTRYPVRYEGSASAPEGNWTFTGRVDTPAGALAAVLTFGKAGVFGVLPAPDGSMMKLTTRAGQAYLQPAGWSIPPGVDPSQHPDYVLPEAIAAGVAQASGSVASSPATLGQRADAGSGVATISILAAYTRNLSQLRGSALAARTEYHNLVAVMNQAHADSGSRARFEIAAFVELDYPAGNWNDKARKDIIDNTLPDGTNVHALRNQHAADLVALIRPYVDGDLTCGIAQFPGPPLQPHALDPQTGFSVTAVEACAPLVFAHEIGHNLGLMHDRETVAGPHGGALAHGLHRFSFGHRQLGPPGFATVMAYDSESRPRLGLFSHPDSGWCGGADCGEAALADNVRTINLVAESISRFRDPPGVIAINDAWTREASGDRHLYMTVNLSSPAAFGGITFDVEVAGGSAELGVDADVVGGAPLRDLVIGAGQKSALFVVRVRADDLVEPAETLLFRLANVRGNVAVLDDEATLTIVDDDTTVSVDGRVRFPQGTTLPASASVLVKTFDEGFADEYRVDAMAPAYAFVLDVPRNAFLSMDASTASLWMQPVVVERVDGAVPVADLRLSAPVKFAGRLKTPGGGNVNGVPVILWNVHGDGSGYYGNWTQSGYGANYAMDAMPGMSMQLEVRNPPAPYVRQVVEVPRLVDPATVDLTLRDVPSLTIPHVTVPEGSAADGPRTVLLTASLSLPRSKTGVTFDIQLAGTADADDFILPQTHFSIAKGRSRVEVPVIVVGDDVREPDEVVELRITNVQGAAWNPGPGSLRIATDDQRAGDGRCTGSTDGGSVRMCQ